MDYGETQAHASAATAANHPAGRPVEGPRQRGLDFAAAEASHAERRNWLGLAILAAGGDLHLATLCRLVFETTHGGATDQTAARTVEALAARPWGLCCGRTKAKATISRAVAAGLLALEQTYHPTGARGPNAYQIDWAGIRQTLRLDHAPVEHTPQRGPVAIRPGTGRDTTGDRSRYDRSLMGGKEESQAATPGQTNDLQPNPPGPGENGPGNCYHGHGSLSASATMDHGTMEAAAALAEAVAAGRAVATAAAGEVVPQPSPDRQNQKTRIVGRIIAAVADPAFHPSIAGRAADLVTVHGLPPRDLLHVLADLDAMRAAGRLTNAGGFFLTKARQLAARHGLPWPNPKDKPR